MINMTGSRWRTCCLCLGFFLKEKDGDLICKGCGKDATDSADRWQIQEEKRIPEEKTLQ